MNIRLFLVLCFFTTSFSAFSAESIRTVTGFYYPIGTDNLQVPSCGRWLTKPSDMVVDTEEDCYLWEFDETSIPVYHIGVDILADYETSVRAIADGKVKPWSYDGWGANNIALVVEHESAEHGSYTAIYGHVRRSDAKAEGSTVHAGEVIGKIGYWDNGNHLHFGIVHPNLTYPMGGFGRANWNQWGILNGAYYDNGLIDPIDFIVHNGPDNYISRGSESVPNSITTKSSWFYDLCWAQSPDFRCDMNDVVWYSECVLEKNTLCAVDPSVWSAVKETGKTSGNTYGVGGDGYIPPQNPTPTDPVNLTQDTDILGADGNELYAGRDSILPGMKVKVRVAVQAEGGDAGNWKTRNNADTIDIAYSVSSNDGPWTQFDTGYITISKLDEGQTITETKEYTIPNGISSIAFRTETDYRDEVEEYDEGDNTSRVERFEISNLKPDYSVTDVFFSDPSTGAIYRNGAILLEDREWYPYCEIMSTGEINAPINVEVSHRMDGTERDTDTLGIDDISLGQTYREVVWSKWKLGNTGTRTYTCCVDSKGWLPELNESNNCKSALFTIVPWKPSITITDLWVDYDGKVVRNGGTGSKGKRYHPNVTFTNTGNKTMSCGAEAKYYINSNSYRDRDGIDPLSVNQSGHERVENDNIKLGDGGWRSYRVTIQSSCGEFPTVERTISFYLR